jgi:hypothetical protein
MIHTVEVKLVKKFNWAAKVNQFFDLQKITLLFSRHFHQKTEGHRAKRTRRTSSCY